MIICDPDCKDRSTGCHGKCEKYKKYEAQKETNYRRRQEKVEFGDYVSDKVHRIRAIAKHRHSGRK